MIDKVIEVRDLPEVLLAEKSENEMMLSQSSGLSSGKLKNATATVSQVLIGKTFYSGDKSIKTGTMTNRGSWIGTYSGSNIAIPVGYHNGSGYVTVSGGNKGAWGTTINPGGSVTIPKGYHNGSGVVRANSVQSFLKSASFSLSLFSGGIAYGEIKDAWWSPGGTVIGMTKCKIRTDTESGEACSNETYCEISNGQVHFVTNYTHRGGWTYAEGTVVYI